MRKRNSTRRKMRICYFLFELYWFLYLSYVTSHRSIYESVTCLSQMSETYSGISAKFQDCAILSHFNLWIAFSFDKQTSQCKGFIEAANAVTTCSSPGGAQFYTVKNRTLKNHCSLPPVPSDYILEHPYNGNTDLSRYRCRELTDQPPFDHCPIVKCGSNPDMSTPPASCSVKDWFNMTLEEYEGGVTCTIEGLTCQRWDADEPHLHSYYNGRSDLGNRCQLGGEDRPWCYTMDPDTRWDYCPFANLNCENPPIAKLPPSMTGARIKVEWPHQQFYELAWYKCASSVITDPVPSCPLTHCDVDRNWSKVNVSCSVKDCYNATSLTYNGRVSCTVNGIPCQRWDTDEPHSHSILSGRSDLENWCQVADEDKPWCYTTNPHFRWQYCPVEECPLGS